MSFYRHSSIATRSLHDVGGNRAPEVSDNHKQNAWSLYITEKTLNRLLEGNYHIDTAASVAESGQWLYEIAVRPLI